MAATPIFFAADPMTQRSLLNYIPWGLKEIIRLGDLAQGLFHVAVPYSLFPGGGPIFWLDEPPVDRPLRKTVKQRQEKAEKASLMNIPRGHI